MGQYDPPSMGVNYGTLAQLTKPQMRGNAPVGDGFGAGADYARDESRHDAMLRQAAMMAQRDAELKAQAADEYGMAGPGRLSDIRTKNALAEGQEGMLPNLLSNQRRKIEAEGSKYDQAEFEAQIKKLDEFAQEWKQAKDPSSKEDIVERMKAAGLSKIGPKTVDELHASGKLDGLMERRFNKLVNSPAHLQKREIEGDKAAAALKKEQEKIASREKVAKWVQEAKSKANAAKYQKAENPAYVMFRDVYARAQTIEEKDAVITWWQNESRALEAAKAGRAPQQLDLKPDMSGVEVRPPPPPAPAKPPPRMGGDTPGAAPKATPTPAHVNGYKQMIAKDPSKKAMIDAEWTRKFGTPPPK